MSSAAWTPTSLTGRNRAERFLDDPSIQGWSLYLDASYYNDLMRVGLAFLMTSGEKHFWGDGVRTRAA